MSYPENFNTFFFQMQLKPKIFEVHFEFGRF